MTPQELELHGLNRFEWNNGTIIEYWKSLSGDNFDCRLAVRFGEFKNKPFVVWLIFPYYMYAVENVTTNLELEILYNLMRRT